MAKRPKQNQFSFEGFDRPESNWFRMPNSWTNITAGITSIAELKVVEYILRHTWGYQEYGLKKHITIDEFVNGRRRHDGERMDRGTGLSERAVYDGLRKAVEEGLIEEEVDATDRGRVKKSYCLRMRSEEGVQTPKSADRQDLQLGVQTLHPDLQRLHPPLQTLPPSGAKSAPRSEKDNLERQNDSNIRKTKPNGDNSEIMEETETPVARRQPRGVRTIADVLQTSRVGETVANWQHRSVQAASPATRDENGAPRPPGPRRRGRPRRLVYDEDREVLLAFIEDFSREFNDRAPLSASVTRAYNLLRRSGLPRDAFLDQLYQARAITKERSASIRSRAGTDPFGLPTKNKMAYFFAVLEDLLEPSDDRGGPTLTH